MDVALSGAGIQAGKIFVSVRLVEPVRWFCLQGAAVGAFKVLHIVRP